jgi:ABC-type Mn2+/Zn2+ transport system ATPase subunit
MGPSGAGKTVLISTLTLDALFGRASGSVTLNGVPLTDEIFKQHAYVVVQHDKLWPYLTCRETMRYAAELYAVERASLDAVVDSVINKLGLRICADTRNARLSGGQQRRLSLALALLKNPTLLFLGTCVDDTHNSSLVSLCARNAKCLTPHFLLVIVCMFLFSQTNPRPVWTRRRPKRLCKRLSVSRGRKISLSCVRFINPPQKSTMALIKS